MPCAKARQHLTSLARAVASRKKAKAVVEDIDADDLLASLEAEMDSEATKEKELIGECMRALLVQPCG